MREGYIGVDIGTQGIKAVVIDENGTLLVSSSELYATSRPVIGWQEQNPYDWLSAYDTVMDRIVVDPSVRGIRFVALGFTGQMHTLVACDGKGVPLRPAILWSDTRSAPYAAWLKQQYGLDSILNYTGNLPLSNFSLLRLLWIKEHEPHIFSKIRKLFVAKDWIRYQISGVFATDVTDASGTLLFDVQKRSWAKNWIQELGIMPQWLGTVQESLDYCGVLRRGPTNLQGIPVITGAGDQEASAVGTGIRSERDLGISLGTSGVIFWPMNNFQIPNHPSVHAFCHAYSDKWHWMSVTQSAAASMQWYRETFGAHQTFSQLDSDAMIIPKASEGLLFFPYLQGERAPLMNPHAMGTYMGISPSHTSSHFIRAILEGVAFSLKHAWDIMKGAGDFCFDRIVVTGGGAKSRLWMQILSDVFEHPLYVVDDPGAAVGAAWMGRMAHQGNKELFPLAVQEVVEPTTDANNYRGPYQRYVAIADSLNRLWREL